ncbi:MAG: hypothetical protein CMC59_03120 [Flavobacteriaceae bacterium]|nr:hypothetical protein [Flavobacteriaceae bacterium]|tara:strand:+ start:169 stop:519 length:351 start_codon:yes stop_codon:yes gene_type:complete
MNFNKKIKFFSFGLLLGTFFLVTILNGKNLSCNYGPESRVINNLKQKKWTFDNEKKALDTFNLVDFLENSKVVFNKSNTKKDSCKVYYLKGISKYKGIIINAENCSKIVNVKVIEN